MIQRTYMQEPATSPTLEVRRVNGVPDFIPSPDQPPIALDHAEKVIYFFDRTASKWFEIPTGFSNDQRVTLDVIAANNVVKVPVFYTVLGETREGYVDLKELVEHTINNMNSEV